MSKLKSFIKNSPNRVKLNYLILLVLFTLFLSLALPSLARYKNRISMSEVTVWDGTIASSYRKGSGTQSNPYVISNGSELAYFSQKLKTNNYNNVYFELNSDIVLNDGIFSYDETNGVLYTKNIETANLFEPLAGFEGFFNGNSYRIYGLYIKSNTEEELALFTNLKGSISNLYVENSLIQGGNITAGISSTSENSTINNVLYNGFVLGNQEILEQTKENNLNEISETLENTLLESEIDLNAFNLPKGKIVSISLTGTYGVSNEFGTLKINNEVIPAGDFEINLTSEIKKVPLLYETTDNTTFTLTNLKYNIKYKYSVAAGIVGIGKNITLDNVINKSDVYGNIYSSGLMGDGSGNSKINKSYNTGKINSENISSGLIAHVSSNNNNIEINKSYNSGVISSTFSSSLIGEVLNNTGTITINDSFNPIEVSDIYSVVDTNITVTNSYSVSNTSVEKGTITGSFIETSLSNLKNKTFLQSNLTLNEFNSKEDAVSGSNNVWVFESGYLPLLFIDDLNNPVANINVGTNLWNDLGYDLSTLKFSSSFAFKIESFDSLRPIKEAYYYLSSSKEALTKNQIENISDWVEYQNITSVTDEGFYVIYVKILDYNDNISYINTDLLVLDLSKASVTISKGSTSWNNLRSELNSIYIADKTNLTIEAIDELSGVDTVHYYVSDQILTEETLSSLPIEEWKEYTNNILIDGKGIYIVYARVKDYCDYISYANSDYIIMNGYSQLSLKAGKNGENASELYITDKSSVSLNFKYVDEMNGYEEDYSHKLISNVLLPDGSKITIVDKIKNKVYKHIVMNTEDNYGYLSSCGAEENCIKKATYSFDLFTEVGTFSSTKVFNETENTGSINEDFIINVDFKNTNIDTNLENVQLYLELQDINGVMKRTTLKSTKKEFSVYSNLEGESTKAYLVLTGSSVNEILYNSNSENNIDFSAKLEYKKINGKNIIDTTFEDKNIGLSLKLTDSENNIITKKYLKNTFIKIDINNYYPDSEGLVKIDLENGLNTTNKILIIGTNEDNIKLPKGNYYFKLGIYASYDGKYSSDIYEKITIPVNVTSSSINSNYNFDVIVDESNRIIDKSKTIVPVNFKILEKSNELTDPNIRVSLYKKNTLSAYDQSYSLIDLNSYITNNLELSSDLKYYVTKNPISYNGTSSSYNNLTLNFTTSSLDNHGYKLVFYLYDGNKMVGSIDKKIIAK